VLTCRDCPACRSEGFEAQSRVELQLEGRSVVATLNVVTGDFLSSGEAGLSEAARRLLGAREDAVASLRHPAQLASLSHLRAKIHGSRTHGGAGG
jgi:thymidine phosphorylase